jgi:protein-S-isoprenylcysteine O-methyltransferase Ste14
MTAERASTYLWLVWYVTWIAAVVWSARTKTQMKTDMGGAPRLLAGLGSALLFLPSSGRPVFHLAVTGWVTHKLWRGAPAFNWGLFALIVAAFGFCWWARIHLGRLWSGFVTLKDGHCVVDTGPYRLVRHPIYSGVMLGVLLTALIRATPAGLAGFVCMAAGFSMIAKIEERFLRDQLGAEAYDDYSRKTPMMIPRLG